MIESILQWDTLQKIIFNTILVSIPEEIYLVMFTLILLGEFDYWKDPECKKLIHNYDYIRILLPAITIALLLNIFRYTGFDSGYSSLISILLFYIIIILTNDIFGDASALKWMGKAFLFLIIGYMTIGLSELMYIPLILYGTEITIEEINNNILLNFLISIPSRIILFFVLLYFIFKKRTLLKGNIFKHILTNPILLALTSLIAILNVLFLWVMYKLIIFEKLLINLTPTFQSFIIVGVIVIPIVNISLFLWIIYYIKNRELKEKKNVNEELYNLVNEMKLYVNSEKSENIKWKINEIGLGIEEVATNLYKDIETDKKNKK